MKELQAVKKVKIAENTIPFNFINMAPAINRIYRIDIKAVHEGSGTKARD